MIEATTDRSNKQHPSKAEKIISRCPKGWNLHKWKCEHELQTDLLLKMPKVFNCRSVQYKYQVIM